MAVLVLQEGQGSLKEHDLLGGEVLHSLPKPLESDVQDGDSFDHLAADHQAILHPEIGQVHPVEQPRANTVIGGLVDVVC